MRAIVAGILGGVSLIALAPPVMAQSAEPSVQAQAADGIGEIVVSARRRDESLSDVPLTVNVVTSEQIDKLNLRDFSDISAIVPGLTLTGSSNGFSTAATVRGVAFNVEAGGSPTVEFYLNDSSIDSLFLFQSMFDVGQFELLRGPQGTLRGRAAPSGSITVTTRRPDLSEAGMMMNGTMTDKHAYKGEAAINVPILRDILGVRLAGVVDENEGTRVRSIRADSLPQYNPDPFRKSKALRASVRFEPVDFVSANFMFQTLDRRNLQYDQAESARFVTGGTDASSPVIRPFDRLSIFDGGSPSHQRLDIYNWSIDVHQAGQKLSYVGSRTIGNIRNLGMQDSGDYFSPDRFTPADRSFADPAGDEPVCATNAAVLNYQPSTLNYGQCLHTSSKTTSHEIRLASEERIAGIFDYVIGYFEREQTSDARLTQETPIINNFTNPPSVAFVNLTPIVRGGRNKEKSFFGNITAHVSDAFELSGGLRRIKYHDRSILDVSGARLSDTDDHFKTTIFNASAKYRFSDDLMVYATAGSSWRAGIHAVGDFSFRKSARENSFLDLRPERSKSYEAGIKASFLNKRAYVNLSVFHQDFNGYFYRGPGVFFVNYTYNQQSGGIVSNVGTFNFVSSVPVKVDGFELEASFKPTSRWSISGNVSYANGRIKNGTIACNDLNGDGVPDVNPATPTVAELDAAAGPGNNVSQCKVNGPANFSPKWSANLQSEYDFPVARSVDGFVRGLMTYYPSYKQDPANPFDNVKGYALTNVYVGGRSEDGSWELSLFAKNVFATRRKLHQGGGGFGGGSTPASTSLQTFTGATTYTSPYYFLTTTAPREFGVNLRLAFGSR